MSDKFNKHDPEGPKCTDLIRVARKLRRLKKLHNGNVKPRTIERVRGEVVAAAGVLFDEFGLASLADACQEAVQEFDGRHLEE